MVWVLLMTCAPETVPSAPEPTESKPPVKPNRSGVITQQASIDGVFAKRFGGSVGPGQVLGPNNRHIILGKLSGRQRVVQQTDMRPALLTGDTFAFQVVQRFQLVAGNDMVTGTPGQLQHDDRFGSRDRCPRLHWPDPACDRCRAGRAICH